MNENQQNAIDAHLSTLTKVLQWGLFEVYLSGNGFLSDNECQVVSASGPTNDHKIIKIFSLLKWKEGSWELVMKYLRDHKYPWLATELLVEAKMKPTEDVSPKQPSMTTPVREQHVSAATAGYNTASSQSSSPSGSQTFSAKPQLRVSPVTQLAQSTSDLSIYSRPIPANSDATPNTKPQFLSTQTDEGSSVESFIATLKQRSRRESFGQFLPDIITLMRIFPTTTKVQLECIRLTRLFLPQHLSELTDVQKENLVKAMLCCLQTNSQIELIVECTNTMSKLDIFADPIDKYTKTVEVLLKIISNPEMTTKTKSWTIWLLNKIMLNSDENRQNLVGQIGGVEKICAIIKKHLCNVPYDRILVFSWNCLDNLCAKSPENNKKFFSAGGIGIFDDCYKKFDDEVELVEMMMGMMWQISSFPSVKSQLVSQRNFDVFWKILIKYKSNVTVSYRCVRFFDKYLSDSTFIWPLDSPTVEEAKKLLTETVCRWQLDSPLNLNPNTFERRLCSLKSHLSPLSDLITVWSIASFTTVDAPKYCRMLVEEGGVEILTTEVIRNSNSSLDAIRLAIVALDNINRWDSTANQH